MPADAATLVERGSRGVIAVHVARRCVRGALAWGVVFGAVVYTSVAGYASAYPTAASREHLASSLGSNAGLAALLGPARGIDTVAGFTAWRSVGVLGPLGAVWALLLATRLLRGEEERGRWELILAAPTTRRGATVQALAGLAAGWAVLLVNGGLLVALAGRADAARFPVGSSVFLAVALVSPAAMFLAVGAVCSQVAHTRRQAAALAGGVFGAAIALRLVADSGPSLEWARWLSPLGWVEEMRPLGNSNAVPLLAVAGLTAVLVATSLWLAGARDLGASLLPDRDTAVPRTRLLGSPLGLAVRLARPQVAAWCIGLACAGLVMGLVARAAGDATAGSSAAQQALARIGGGGVGAAAYLGFAFLIVGTVIALLAAGQVAAAREEEADARLDNLVSAPVSGAAWLVGRLGVAASAVVAAAVVSGCAAWVGAATQQSGVGLSRLVLAGVNTVPAALFVLGVGTLAYGVAPRVAAAVAYGVVASSFLIEVVGTVADGNRWLLDLSVFHHVSPVPAADPAWGSAAALTLLGIGAAALGTLAFARRDLTGA